MLVGSWMLDSRQTRQRPSLAHTIAHVTRLYLRPAGQVSAPTLCFCRQDPQASEGKAHLHTKTLEKSFPSASAANTPDRWEFGFFSADIQVFEAGCQNEDFRAGRWSGRVTRVFSRNFFWSANGVDAITLTLVGLQSHAAYFVAIRPRIFSLRWHVNSVLSE